VFQQSITEKKKGNTVTGAIVPSGSGRKGSLTVIKKGEQGRRSLKNERKIQTLRTPQPNNKGVGGGGGGVVVTFTGGDEENRRARL